MEIVFATNNEHKLREIKELLGSGPYSVKSLEQLGCTDELPETHETLEENSLEKAHYVFQKYHCDCMAEDTGLEVYALDGEPGVYSARYAGEERDSAKNMALLLERLGNKTDRNARFRTVITLIINGIYVQFEGIAEGSIAGSLSGVGGFGYDPIFVPSGDTRTFAELSSKEKGTISHRGRALKKLIAFLKERSS